MNLINWSKDKTQPLNKEAGKVLEAFAESLRGMAQNALDTDEASAAKWAEQWEGWAKRIEALLSGGDANGASAAMRSDWASLGSALTNHATAQAEFVNQSFGGLRQVLQACGRSLGEELLASRSEGAQLQEAGVALESALQTGDSDAVRAAAQSVLTVSTRVSEARRVREEGRRRLLGERMRDAKAELGEPRDETTLDAKTGLYNQEALKRHLERVVDFAPLFPQPPCLIVLELDIPVGNTELLAQVASCVGSTFLRRQDFVARTGDAQFSVALVDITLANVEVLCDRVEQSLRQLKGVEAVAPTLAIGASAWFLGEGAAAWAERVTAMLPQARAAGGRRRSVKPPPAQ